MKTFNDLRAAFKLIDNLVMRAPVATYSEKDEVLYEFQETVLSSGYHSEAVLTKAFTETLSFKYNNHALHYSEKGFEVFDEYLDMLGSLGIDVKKAIIQKLSGDNESVSEMSRESFVNFSLNRLPPSLKQRSWQKLPQVWLGVLLMRSDLVGMDPTQFNDHKLLQLYKLTSDPAYAKGIQGDLAADALTFDLGL